MPLVEFVGPHGVFSLKTEYPMRAPASRSGSVPSTYRFQVAVTSRSSKSQLQVAYRHPYADEGLNSHFSNSHFPRRLSLTGTRADWRALLKFSIQIYLDDFPVPAAARVSLQRSRPRRLSAPNARPNVDDLVPTDAQVPLWRSGPVGRSDAITTVWPHRTLK